MHVLLLSEYPRDPSHNPGGHEAVAKALAERLATYPNVRMTVLTCESGLEEELVLQRDGLTCVYIPSARPKIVTRVIRDIPRITRKVREISPDLIHSHLAWYTCAALRSGFPTVWTVHAITFNQRQDWPGLSGLVRGFVYNHIDRYCLKHLRHIVEISPYVREVFSPCSSAKFHPVENPVEDSFFAVPEQQVKGRILAVGSIEPRKGTLVLLQAVKRLRDRGVSFTLHIVGKSKDHAYFEGVTRFLDEHGMQDQVRLLGIKVGDALRREYAEASVCVLSSREETAPIAILEAMAARRPMVATRVGGNQWLLEEGVTGFLVDYPDERSLAARIEQLLNDASLRDRMGKEAREEAKRRFRTDKIVEETFQVYQEVLGVHQRERVS